ncbi:uncharacterized protein LOC110187042 [Drosophila serrata]|uniref:uncharacterized protein LOC110187042 n=1 Tax=Drosophila serrata TaxID=7274 RepID=UPI000A1D3332|nr:uncharacterized protein LOC110187042 [Drosophila serrata]
MSNNKESYQVLNAELMAEVQKLRLLVAAYKRQVTTLVRENMGLREAQILQGGSGGQQQSSPNGVKNMMWRWKFNSSCLGTSSVSRPSKANSRRYGDIDIAVEEASEIGRPKIATPPVNPTIHEDGVPSDEDDGWKPKNRDSIMRKIARLCGRRVKFL